MLEMKPNKGFCHRFACRLIAALSLVASIAALSVIASIAALSVIASIAKMDGQRSEPKAPEKKASQPAVLPGPPYYVRKIDSQKGRSNGVTIK